MTIRFGRQADGLRASATQSVSECKGEIELENGAENRCQIYIHDLEVKQQQLTCVGNGLWGGFSISRIRCVKGR